MELLIIVLLLILGAGLMVVPEKKVTKKGTMVKVVCNVLGISIFVLGIVLFVGIQYVVMLFSMIGL